MNTLPFVIVQHPTEGYRDGPTELELALVLSLVTRNRRRVGLLKRRRKERVRSIARFLWPFYQMGDSVAIDGTGLFETRLKCPTIPQFDNLAVSYTHLTLPTILRV